jgi:hypothetical protein
MQFPSYVTHRIVHRVVVALVFGTGVRGAPRRPQRLQDRGEHRRAPGGQVAGEDPGPGERGLDPDLAVFEGRLRVIVVLGAGQGAGVDLGGQRGQVLFAAPPGGGQQDPVGRVPAGLGRRPGGPSPDAPGPRPWSPWCGGSARTSGWCGDGHLGLTSPGSVQAGPFGQNVLSILYSILADHTNISLKRHAFEVFVQEMLIQVRGLGSSRSPGTDVVTW